MAGREAPGRRAGSLARLTEVPSAGRDFLIAREPAHASRLPVLVSIPHFGSDPIPGLGPGDYREPRFASFPYGYTDPFARQIYGRLHEIGASVLATPLSRLFVDVNRARDDFEVRSGEVRSQRGVMRTHARGDTPIFREPLRLQSAQQRLARYYDPYHEALADRIGALRARFRHAVLIDAHTADLAGSGGRDVVIGTRRGRTCSPALALGVAQVVRAHGFTCTFDLPGYSGGHIVRRHGKPDGPVQALQIEFCVSRIMRTTRREYARACQLGQAPAHDAARLARCIACMRDVVGWLGRRGGRPARSQA